MNKYLEQLRSKTQEEKKRIMIASVVVVGLVMLFFWYFFIVRKAISNLSKQEIKEAFKTEDLEAGLSNLPSLEKPLEQLKQLEQELKTATYEE